MCAADVLRCITAGPCVMAGDGSDRERVCGHVDVGTAVDANAVSTVLVDTGMLRPHAWTVGVLAWAQGMTRVLCMLELLSLAQ